MFVIHQVRWQGLVRAWGWEVTELAAATQAMLWPPLELSANGVAKGVLGSRAAFISFRTHRLGWLVSIQSLCVTRSPARHFR